MSDCNQMNYRSARGTYQRGGAASNYNGTTGASNYRQGNPMRSGCGYTHNDPLRGMALTMGYVPWQQWQDVYEPDKALQRATIFPELDKPFCGVRGGRRG